jgi:hypothetical protein
METKNPLLLKYSQKYVDALERIRARLNKVEKELQVENPDFKIAKMWGWNDFNGLPSFYTTEHCVDLNLKNLISKIISEELNKLSNPTETIK